MEPSGSWTAGAASGRAHRAPPSSRRCALGVGPAAVICVMDMQRRVSGVCELSHRRMPRPLHGAPRQQQPADRIEVRDDEPHSLRLSDSLAAKIERTFLS